jgi:tetratricopeptide (TPR) repeat protein
VVEGGPGWHLDPVTLRPVITDESVFRSHHADDPALDALVALWNGAPDEALEALRSLLDTDPRHWRWRALRADARRDLGKHDAAIADLHELVGEHAGTGREAVLLQHLGKAYLAAGEYASATTCFERALSLRTAARADSSLIASSRAALARSRQLGRSHEALDNWLS